MRNVLKAYTGGSIHDAIEELGAVRDVEKRDEFTKKYIEWCVEQPKKYWQGKRQLGEFEAAKNYAIEQARNGGEDTAEAVHRVFCWTTDIVAAFISATQNISNGTIKMRLHGQYEQKFYELLIEVISGG